MIRLRSRIQKEARWLAAPASRAKEVRPLTSYRIPQLGSDGENTAEPRSVVVGAAGDPFFAEGERCSNSACLGGFISMTYEEDGEEYDVLVKCRRCAEKETLW